MVNCEDVDSASEKDVVKTGWMANHDCNKEGCLVDHHKSVDEAFLLSEIISFVNSNEFGLVSNSFLSKECVICSADYYIGRRDKDYCIRCMFIEGLKGLKR